MTEISPLVGTQQKQNCVHQKTCSNMFLKALFETAPKWKDRQMNGGIFIQWNTIYQ